MPGETTYTVHATGKLTNRWALAPARWAFKLGAWLLRRVQTVVLVDGKPLDDGRPFNVDVTISPGWPGPNGFDAWEGNGHGR